MEQQDGQASEIAVSHTHIPQDSVMSIASSKDEDVDRIRELEEEVRLLAEKANTASQRYADYENEIRVLEAKLRQEQRKNSAPTETSIVTAAAQATRPGISRFNSINSFMGSARKISPTPMNGSLQALPESSKELEEQVIKEQTARIAADKKAKELSAEIEDLTATLFQQANEMVATERKENSALKEKVMLLEQHQQLEQEHELPADVVTLQKENTRLKEKVKTLEERDVQRNKRLDRLEAANKRIERVRAMLKPP